MSRPRDSQRAKVWKVEGELRTILHPSRKDLTYWAENMTDSAWFQNRCNNRTSRKAWDIPMTVTAGHCNAIGRPGGWTLKLRGNRRDQLGVIHALAHILADQEVKRLLGSSLKEPWHGRTFARNYLELIQHVFGNDAAKEVRRLYKEHAVKRIVVSEETREKRRVAWENRQASEAKRIWGEFLSNKENDV